MRTESSPEKESAINFDHNCNSDVYAGPVQFGFLLTLIVFALLRLSRKL